MKQQVSFPDRVPKYYNCKPHVPSPGTAPSCPARQGYTEVGKIKEQQDNVLAICADIAQEHICDDNDQQPHKDRLATSFRLQTATECLHPKLTGLAALRAGTTLLQQQSGSKASRLGWRVPGCRIRVFDIVVFTGGARYELQWAKHPFCGLSFMSLLLHRTPRRLMRVRRD